MRFVWLVMRISDVDDDDEQDKVSKVGMINGDLVAAATPHPMLPNWKQYLPYYCISLSGYLVTVVS